MLLKCRVGKVKIKKMLTQNCYGWQKTKYVNILRMAWVQFALNLNSGKLYLFLSLIFMYHFFFSLFTIIPTLRLAGTMVDLISQNQPSSLDAFIINFQSWVQFIVRTLPLKMANKGSNSLFSIYTVVCLSVPLKISKWFVMCELLKMVYVCSESLSVFYFIAYLFWKLHICNRLHPIWTLWHYWPSEMFSFANKYFLMSDLNG